MCLFNTLTDQALLSTLRGEWTRNNLDRRFPSLFFSSFKSTSSIGLLGKFCEVEDPLWKIDQACGLAEKWKSSVLTGDFMETNWWHFCYGVNAVHIGIGHMMP